MAASAALLAAAAPAMAATQHWASSTQVPYGTSQSFSSQGLSNIPLNWNFSGTQVQMQCSTLTAPGTAENPSGGGAGTLALASIKLGNCEINVPNCTISKNSITLEGKPSTVAVSGKDEIKYDGGLQAGTLRILGSGCALAGSYPINGTLVATAEPSEPGVYYLDNAESNLTVVEGALSVAGYFSLATSSEEPMVLSSTASPGSPHWYRDSAAWSDLGSGESSSFVSNGALSFDLKTTQFGTPLELACSGTANSVSGSVENPIGGGPGTVTASFSMGECSAPNLSGCTVEQPWNWNPLAGVATEVGEEGKAAIDFALSGANEKPVFQLNGEACTVAGKYRLEGHLTATSDGDGGFDLSASSLWVNKKAAVTTGAFALQRENAESLRLQP